MKFVVFDVNLDEDMTGPLSRLAADRTAWEMNEGKLERLYGVRRHQAEEIHSDDRIIWA